MMSKRILQTAIIVCIILIVNTVISGEEKYIQNDYQKVTITRNVSQGTAESFEIKQVDYLTPDPDYTFTLNKSPIWNAILFYPDYSADPDTMAPISIWPDSLNSTNVDSFPWGGGAQQSQDSLWFQWRGVNLKEQDEHLSGKMDVTCSVAFRNGDRKAHWHVNLQLNSVDEDSMVGIYKIRYPYYEFDELGGPTDGGDDYLTIPEFQGCILNAPISEGIHLWPEWEEMEERGSGYYDNEFMRDEFQFFTWPSHMQMQFFTYYDDNASKGIYIAAQDPDKYMKSLFYRKRMKTSPSDSTLALYFTYFPEDIFFVVDSDSSYCDSVEVPYSMVTDVFEGDWLDGSKIYREWALEQSWCDSGKFETRSDIGTIAKDLDYFIFFGTPFDSFDADQDTIIDAAIDSMNTNGYTLSKPLVAIPMAADRHNWQWKSGYADNFVAPLFEEHGESLMIASNFTSNEWPMIDEDTTSASNCTSYQENENWCDVWDDVDAEYWVVKNVNGDINERYTESGGQYLKCWWRNMCQGSDDWVEYFVDSIASLVDSARVDTEERMGLSACILSKACMPRLCFISDHYLFNGQGETHPTGGGTWWADGWREYFLAVKDTLTVYNAEKHYLFSETSPEINVELCCPHAEGQNPSDKDLKDKTKFPNTENIPIFQSVYHDYVPTAFAPRRWNEFTAKHDPDGLLWTYIVGQSMIWGKNLGFRLRGGDEELRYRVVDWVEAEEGEGGEDFNYIRHLIQRRSLVKEYLNYGEYVRPLEIFCDDSSYVHFIHDPDKYGDSNDDSLYVCNVLHSAWKYSPSGDDTTIGIVFTNFSDSGAVIDTVTIDVSEWEIEDQSDYYSIEFLNVNGNWIDTGYCFSSSSEWKRYVDLGLNSRTSKIYRLVPVESCE